MTDKEKHIKRLQRICDIVIVILVILMIGVGFKAYDLYQKYGFKSCIQDEDVLTGNITTLCFNSTDERTDYLEELVAIKSGDKYINPDYDIPLNIS